MMPYDFRYLTHVQKAILAAGGWRPGDYVVGAAHHSRPSKPCLEGLIRRGFLNVCAPPHQDAYYVPSEVAAAFRASRGRRLSRPLDEVAA